MIRMVAVTVAMLGLLTAHAFAQSTLAFWQGVAVVDSASSACKNNGFVKEGDAIKSSYRARLDDAEPNSGITFIGAWSMQAYFNNTTPPAGPVADDQMRGKGTYALRIIRGNVTRDFNMNSAPGEFTFKIKPNVIDATTDNVTIEGMIKDWRGVAGCTVKFRGSYRAASTNAAD